jgi:23S rRNA (cytosine1962-C5)-methyltransferase
MQAHPIPLRLKPGRDRSVRERHPWIFSGALAAVGGEGIASGVADVRSQDGEWLARGFYHPGANLAVRLASWSHDEPLDENWVTRRIAAAVARREPTADPLDRTPETTARRLVFAEADGLPGLIADRYGPAVVARVGALALTPFLPAICRALRALPGVEGLRVEADEDEVEREGLDAGALAALSDPDPGPVAIRENGLRFEVHPGGGQKTGFYLDQRENRRRVAAWAAGRRVLSAYCFTGAFEVAAARSGATEILGLDASAPALEQARRHHEINGTRVPFEYRRGDAPALLRKLRDEGRAFDLAILDPPRFVFNRAQKPRGLRAYKDINLLAMKLLAPGGILASFSCSGWVGPEDLLAVLRWAAADAGREVRVLTLCGQPADHPHLVSFPESAYLKGVIARVDP